MKFPYPGNFILYFDYMGIGFFSWHLNKLCKSKADV